MENRNTISTETGIRSGFTLIELVVTMAVLAIVVTIAAPSVQGIMQRSRLVSTTNDLVSALMTARSEAVKRGGAVTVCKTGNPDAASPSCNAGANWSDGWIVFADDGVRGTVDGGDTMLKIQQPESANGPTVTPSASFSNAITYSAAGSAVSNNTVRDVPTSGDFTVCMNGQSRVVDVALSGRVNTTSGTCP